MSVQYSVAVRNAMLAALPATTGAAAILQVYTGSVPSTCATAASGTLLATMNLPSTYYGTPAAGAMALAGTWQTAAVAAGTAGYYRVMDPTGTTCHEQGTVTTSGGGGDLIVDNSSIAVSQVITVSSKTVTAGNA